MQKLILVINDEKRRYAFNAYRTYEYDNGDLCEDSRCIESDSLEEFLKELKELIENAN